MTNTETLLARLEGLRETGPGRWIARCPAHEDRSPSLSIRELPDGRILLHDFAGCSAVDVVTAVGLSMSDLFPDGGREYRPGQKHRSRVPAVDCLLLASREVMVASIITADFLDKHNIAEADWQRLAQAAARLGTLADEVAR
ncbi:MAG: DNA primase [Gammaproteobacteria bacterium PRO9]|nr:DNA primase [Gammaproteobacteria bacterium PRO9]